MRKKSISFSLFIIIMNASAQETTSNSNSIPIPALKKNEISINTAPVFRMLLNAGATDATRFSITYKRNLNEKSALRFSIVADLIHPDANRYYTIPANEVIILKSDSVLIKQTIEAPSYVSPHLNIGYERLFGKRKLKWFYGADLAIGYAKNRTFKQNIILNRDSTQGSANWVEKEYHPEIISRTNTKTFSIGVSPFFGAKYPISKRFSVSAQVGVDMVYRDQHVSGNGLAIQNGHFSTFDFNQNTGFLNDISLVYKF